MGITLVGGFGLGGFMWLFGVWLTGSKEQEGRVLVMKIFAKACDLGNVGMIVWVFVLH